VITSYIYFLFYRINDIYVISFKHFFVNFTVIFLGAMTVGDRHQTDGMYETDVDMEPPRDDRPGEHLNDNLVKTLEKLCIEDKEGFVTGQLIHEKADTLVAYATVKGLFRKSHKYPSLTWTNNHGSMCLHILVVVV